MVQKADLIRAILPGFSLLIPKGRQRLRPMYLWYVQSIMID